MKKIYTTIASLLIVSMLSGCASTTLSQGGNPDSYSRSQVMTPGLVVEGIVLQAREVNISGSKNATMIGAAIGGLAGAAISNGKSSSLVTVLAGVTGAAAGGLVGAFTSETKGAEIVVRLSNNNVRVIVQEKTATLPAAGQKILVLLSGGEARIVSQL